MLFCKVISMSENPAILSIRLTLFRFDKLRDITFTLGFDVRKEYDFSSVHNYSRSETVV